MPARRWMDDIAADARQLAEQRARLAAERAEAGEQAAALQRALPEMDAAKKAAAAKKVGPRG